MLWKAINDEDNRIDTSDIIHRPLDGHHRVREEDDFQQSNIGLLPTKCGEEAEDLRKISAEQWGEECDWDDADYEEDNLTWMGTMEQTKTMTAPPTTKHSVTKR